LAHWNSFVRIPALVLRQSIWPLPRIGVFEADVLRLRVWPNDVDFNFHLNNARFLSVMDYGRIHLLARGGVVKMVLRERWTPVVGAVWMTYRRSLALWAPFTLSSRMVGWDERWFYMEQVFTGDDGLAAVGWVKGALLGKDGAVKPQRVMEQLEPGIVSPVLPEELLTLNELTREKLRGAL